MRLSRCGWVPDDPVYIDYHDREWGVPLHGDHRLFELLMLEGAQAGLSWLTVLRKRDSYRRAFDQFESETVARYDEKKIAQLLADPGIVRNRRKVHAAVANAKALFAVREACGSFDTYLWQFVNGTPITHAWRTLAEVPVSTKESEAMSRDLARRGFQFVGPTICYAFMQAAGMVNDHTVVCFRHADVARLGASTDAARC
jgi:DNA-3-methyladenine glycosylase I